ncbi:hypothetical protein LCGC14_1659620 [marine sediment metagenome]|uniref:Uncharacterized protein n=1 Tax=marine sediment metagenome TaxID=412755 RepID=A0A0F9KAC5_9ZZZZ
MISSYLWQQTSGTNVTLSDTSSATPSFTAPLVSTDEQLGFQLTVTDDQGATDTANVTITVQNTGTGNLPPVADAGISQTVQEGDSVQLDGSASSDSDGTITNYLWQQTSGTSASLSNTTSATPSFTAPLVIADEQLTFQLLRRESSSSTSSGRQYTHGSLAYRTPL